MKELAPQPGFILFRVVSVIYVAEMTIAAIN
jgi:hypothetical protein